MRIFHPLAFRDYGLFDIYMNVCMYGFSFVYPQALFQLDFNRALCACLWLSVCVCKWVTLMYCGLYAFIHARKHFAWIDTANEQTKNTYEHMDGVWRVLCRNCGGHDNDGGGSGGSDVGNCDSGYRNGDSNFVFPLLRILSIIQLKSISYRWACQPGVVRQAKLNSQAPHTQFKYSCFRFIGFSEKFQKLHTRVYMPAKMSFHSSRLMQ